MHAHQHQNGTTLYSFLASSAPVHLLFRYLLFPLNSVNTRTPPYHRTLSLRSFHLLPKGADLEPSIFVELKWTERTSMLPSADGLTKAARVSSAVVRLFAQLRVALYQGTWTTVGLIAPPNHRLRSTGCGTVDRYDVILGKSRPSHRNSGR